MVGTHLFIHLEESGIVLLEVHNLTIEVGDVVVGGVELLLEGGHFGGRRS